MIDPEKIWSSPHLPTLPAVAIRLLQLSRDPETDVKELVEIIKTDPALSVKILKATNSSFFGIASKVTSIDRAVPLLGTTGVISLALSFSLVDAAMSTGRMAEHYRTYWLQSVVQAVTAELLGKRGGRSGECEYFLGGLLIDLGRLAMLKTVPRDYQPVLDAARDRDDPLHHLERAMLGLDHIQVGMRLMDNWGLSTALVDAARCHHHTLEELQAESGRDSFDLIQATAVAAAVGDYVCLENKRPALERLRWLGGACYGFSGSSLQEFLRRVQSEVRRSSDLFSVQPEVFGDPGDLMAQANEHLAQMAVREHAANAEARGRQQAVEREKRALEAKNQELQKQALFDGLTAAYNRQFFDEALRKEVARCCRYANPLGVLFADIDKFKELNDTYGHRFGDVVLHGVAQGINRMLRSSDILARYGGEEFVILVSQPTEAGLRKAADRIRAQVESEPFRSGEEPVPVTISLGAAIAIPRRDETDVAERLLTAADEAMYEAKRSGRNQVRLRSLLTEQQKRLVQTMVSCRFSRWLVSRNLLDIPTASQALRQCRTPRVRLGDLARQRGDLDAAQIEQVLAELGRNGRRFGETAVQLGVLSEDRLARLLALQQEDPIQLARVLVSLGVFQRETVAVYLKEYLEQFGGRPAPRVVESAPAAAMEGDSAPG